MSDEPANVLLWTEWSMTASGARKLARLILSMPNRLRMASTARSICSSFRFRWESKTHLYKPLVGDLGDPDSDEAHRCQVPEIPQKPAGGLVEHGGGVGGSL